MRRRKQVIRALDCTFCFRLYRHNKMDPYGEVKYEIEPKRGGIFQLWKMKDMPVVNKEMLVILFGFYAASQKTIAQFCEIYFQRGLHVLYIPSHIKHFVWPSNAIRLGEDLVEYLAHEASEYSSFFVHTFSMGSINFAACNYGVMSKQTQKYGHIKKRIKAVVYDSGLFGDTERLIKGIGRGMTRNNFLRGLIPKVASVYFFLTQNYTFNPLVELFDKCRTAPMEVPTLYFFSENDVISDYKYIQEMTDEHRRMGTIPVLEKCWQKSRHCFHLFIHTDDYLSYIDRLFQLIQGPETRNIIKSKM